MLKTEEIRHSLLARRAALAERVGAIKADLGHAEHPLSPDWAELATQRENEEVLSSIGHSSEAEINDINRALMRLDAGEYFICEHCGEEIPEARLRVLPYARRCLACSDLKP